MASGRGSGTGGTSIRPHHRAGQDIKVEAWTTAATGPGEDHSPQTYLDMGYDVVASPSDTLYVTPGSLLLPNPKFLYEQWEPLSTRGWTAIRSGLGRQRHHGARKLLRRVPAPPARGAGRPAVGRPAPRHGRRLLRPRGRDRHPARRARVRAAGHADRHPVRHEPGATPDTFEKAFDGDPSHTSCTPSPNGGYTGVDLGAGRESAVSRRSGSSPGRRAASGGSSAGGSRAAPTGRPAAAGRWPPSTTRPAFGWNELAVTDRGRYRWLRYVGPDGGYATSPRSSSSRPPATSPFKRPRSCASSTTTRSSPATATPAPAPSTTFGSSLGAYATGDRAARTVEPSERARFPVVQPGRTVSTRGGSTSRCQRPPAPTTWSAAPSYQQQPAGSNRSTTGGFTRSDARPRPRSGLDPDFVGLYAGESEATKLQITNHAARAVTIAWHRSGSPRPTPTSRSAPAHGTLTVPAGGTGSAILTASATADAAGARRARRESTSPPAPRANPRRGPARSSSTSSGTPGPQPSLAATYNNAGITDDNNPTAGTFDGGGPATPRRGWPRPGSPRARPSTTTG